MEDIVMHVSQTDILRVMWRVGGKLEDATRFDGGLGCGAK
jgi:hypothetical protein